MEKGFRLHQRFQKPVLPEAPLQLGELLVCVNNGIPIQEQQLTELVGI